MIEPPLPNHSGPSLAVVVSGPSGVGKTTITKRLLEALEAAFSVSMTTRPKTHADTEGVDYFFVTGDRFKQAIDSDELLEWAQVFDHYYGTPRAPLEENLKSGRDVVLDIDVNGGIQVKNAMPEALTIFILPPSEDELLNRLRKRGREDEQKIQRRFREAKREMTAAKESGAYDHFIVNDNLEQALAVALDLIYQHKQTV
ncbi:MAG: guanylate kinase [Phycisphaeraceae bacterium]